MKINLYVVAKYACFYLLLCFYSIIVESLVEKADVDVKRG